jgi:hypothetical protein
LAGSPPRLDARIYIRPLHNLGPKERGSGPGRCFHRIRGNAVCFPPAWRERREQFFLSTGFFTGKDPVIEGWKGPNAAEKEIRKHLKLQA